jgi:MbtH protein
MSNPFEDEAGEYFALVNEEGQYSLWPTFKDVPAGWAPVGPRGARKDVLAYIEEQWVDMRPKSLIALMNADAEKRG